MTTFTAVDTFEIEHCCHCGMAFAMTLNFRNRRRDARHEAWHRLRAALASAQESDRG